MFSCVCVVYLLFRIFIHPAAHCNVVQGSRFKVQGAKRETNWGGKQPSSDRQDRGSKLQKEGGASARVQEIHQVHDNFDIFNVNVGTFEFAAQEVARLAASTSAAGRVQEIQHEQLFSLWQLWRIEGRRHNISICYMHLYSSHAFRVKLV